VRAAFFDASLGRVRTLEPQAPPRLRWARDAAGPEASLARERARLLGGSMESALRFLGFTLEAGGDAELYFGAGAPKAGALWLKPGAGPAQPADSAAARGFGEGDLRLWALRGPYRDDAVLAWPDLDAARGDREALARALRALLERHGSSAPNPTGLAGYRKRLREALARDFDFPEALAALWDGLRPGALSPGSQLAILREADAALNLGLLAPSEKP
jgi:hypothetical protein